MNGYSAEYFATHDDSYELIVNLKDSPMLYFSAVQIQLGKMIRFFCYWLVGMGWLALVVGFMARKLPGI